MTVATEEKEKIVQWAIDDKEDWRREEEIEEDHRKIEKMVPGRFLKWRKVFGKVESERMSMRKVWDHTIDLKEIFKPWKGRIYPLSKNKREEVQNFVEDQLRKGYIRPLKSPQMSQGIEAHPQASLVTGPRLKVGTFAKCLEM